MSDPRGDYEIEHAHGGMSRWAYRDDPKRIAFTSARYKHVAKLLEGKQRVLEVGCADGYFSRIVAQHVGDLVAIDVDLNSIEEAAAAQNICSSTGDNPYRIEFRCQDVFWMTGRFDAVYALDILEHMDPRIDEDSRFLHRLSRLAPVAVIGTPSLESQAYASDRSKEGHVNCMTGPQLVKAMRMWWEHVFLFSLNDEALGTGFAPMAHYRLALCVE